jgi:hypothetical protein
MVCSRRPRDSCCFRQPSILARYLPGEAVKVILVMFIIAFLASLMSIHTAVSRVIWVYGRDGKLPFARSLGKLRGRQSLPITATLVAGIVPMLLFIPLQSEGMYNILIAFTVIGFFLAFTFPVLGFAIARVTKRWTPPSDEPLFLGRWGGPVSWIALAWLVFETINVLWPRESGGGWHRRGDLHHHAETLARHGRSGAHPTRNRGGSRLRRSRRPGPPSRSLRGRAEPRTASRPRAPRSLRDPRPPNRRSYPAFAWRHQPLPRDPGLADTECPCTKEHAMTDSTQPPAAPPITNIHDDSDELEATIPLPRYRPERLL